MGAVQRHIWRGLKINSKYLPLIRLNIKFCCTPGMPQFPDFRTPSEETSAANMTPLPTQMRCKEPLLRYIYIYIYTRINGPRIRAAIDSSLDLDPQQPKLQHICKLVPMWPASKAGQVGFLELQGRCLSQEGGTEGKQGKEKNPRTDFGEALCQQS